MFTVQLHLPSCRKWTRIEYRFTPFSYSIVKRPEFLSYALLNLCILLLGMCLKFIKSLPLGKNEELDLKLHL